MSEKSLRIPSPNHVGILTRVSSTTTGVFALMLCGVLAAI